MIGRIKNVFVRRTLLVLAFVPIFLAAWLIEALVAGFDTFADMQDAFENSW